MWLGGGSLVRAVLSVGDALFDAIRRVLQGECVEDSWFDVDMAKGRVKVASACGEASFAFSTGEGSDEVGCFALVAEDFGDSARISVSLHVGFAGAVMDVFAWRFAPDSKGIDEVAG